MEFGEGGCRRSRGAGSRELHPNPRLMPVFRIYLECTSPTHREDGSFATPIGGSASEFANGLHLEAAMRRAFIAGMGGPHRVLEVLASGLTHTSDSALATSAPVETGEPAMRERLDRALAAAVSADDASRLALAPSHLASLGTGQSRRVG